MSYKFFKKKKFAIVFKNMNRKKRKTLSQIFFCLKTKTKNNERLCLLIFFNQKFKNKKIRDIFFKRLNKIKRMIEKSYQKIL